MDSRNRQRGSGIISADVGLYNGIREKELIMWPAVFGILALSLVLVLVGMLSAHSSRMRHAGTGTTTTAHPAKDQSGEPRRGNNSSNPEATKLAAMGARQTTDSHSEQ